jgi:hypothetical protein
MHARLNRTEFALARLRNPGLAGEPDGDKISVEFKALLPPTGASITPGPVPRAKWPQWAKIVAALAQTGDKGLGDIIRRAPGTVPPGVQAAFAECAWCLGGLNVLYPLDGLTAG